MGTQYFHFTDLNGDVSDEAYIEHVHDVAMEEFVKSDYVKLVSANFYHEKNGLIVEVYNKEQIPLNLDGISNLVTLVDIKVSDACESDWLLLHFLKVFIPFFGDVPVKIEFTYNVIRLYVEVKDKLVKFEMCFESLNADFNIYDEDVKEEDCKSPAFNLGEKPTKTDYPELDTEDTLLDVIEEFLNKVCTGNVLKDQILKNLASNVNYQLAIPKKEWQRETFKAYEDLVDSGHVSCETTDLHVIYKLKLGE